MLELLRIAGQIAALSADRKRKAFVGALAVRRDGVLVASRNGSSSNTPSKSPTAHAEIRVLRKAGYGATLYVARLKRNGELAMAKPCPKCHAMLRSRGVEVVYYTTGLDTWEGYRP